MSGGKFQNSRAGTKKLLALKIAEMQFCVQVFSADLEFQELIHKECKLGVLYYVKTKGNFKIAFQKED